MTDNFAYNLLICSPLVVLWLFASGLFVLASLQDKSEGHI